MPADARRISKFLALVLRHKPEVAGLVLDSHGRACVPAVLAAIQKRFGPYDLDQLSHLVATNDKQRYLLSEDRSLIGAAQGHSVRVLLDLQPAMPPERLYHGTATSSLKSILRRGLIKGRRHHVHLSEVVETAATVGRRHSANNVVLAVNSGAMTDYAFFLSRNGVWLTDHVPPNFLSILRA